MLKCLSLTKKLMEKILLFFNYSFYFIHYYNFQDNLFDFNKFK